MENEVAAASVSPAPSFGRGGATAAADRAARISGRADTDGDDRITRPEARTAGRFRFELMEADADGRAHLEEMTRAARARTGGQLGKRFERRAANGDGAVERGESADPAARRFGRFGTEGGGAATRDEVESGIRRGG
jgi:hypothetical protein